MKKLLQILALVAFLIGTLFAVPGAGQTVTRATSRIASGVLSFSTFGTLSFVSDGVAVLKNNAGTDFNRLQFGGTTSSFPALKRNTSSLQVRLADDSAYTTLQAGSYQADNFTILTGGKHFVRGTAPTVGSGFGTSPTVPNSNGTVAFTVNVGTGGTATSGVITLPAASTGWNCYVNAPAAPTMYSRQTATTTTSATISNYNSAGTLTAWAASTVLNVSCFGY